MIPDFPFQMGHDIRVINIPDNNAQFNQEINNKEINRELNDPFVIHPHIGHHGKDFSREIRQRNQF
jgi:hypothetical protein